MEFTQYIDKWCNFYTNILSFIDSNNDYQDLLSFIKNWKKENMNIYDINLILLLISKLSNNHHRSPNFFNKLEQIILIFKDEISQNFSNSNIFTIFKKNKRILYFLINERLLVIDEQIANVITKENYYVQAKYPNYFISEIKPFLQKKALKKLEQYNKSALTNLQNNEDLNDFEALQKNGENENLICQLIRNDSINEFIEYINQKNFSISMIIKPSIFETNPLLIKKNPTLIEYAAFFGSVQIFKYLFLNGSDLNSSLWLFVIHGRNAELIHFLEENKIEPKNKDYQEFINEAIKCHHNELATYIYDNLFSQPECEDCIDPFVKSFKYINFELFPNNLTNHITFYYLCKYDYTYLVELILKTQDLDVNTQIIFSAFLTLFLFF